MIMQALEQILSRTRASNSLLNSAGGCVYHLGKGQGWGYILQASEYQAKYFEYFSPSNEVSVKIQPEE